MKNILILFAGVIIFIVLVGLLTQKVQNKNLKREISVGNTKIKVDVADTEEERKQGLSGKTSLGENEGMLFVFEQKDVYPSFWMRGMRIPIDIIWVNDGIVTKIDKNISAPGEGTPDSALQLYHPDAPIDYVLEVNAGFSDKNELKVGDKVDLNEGG
jgi:uncharacterized membrane protein (UPF0127 family)